MGLVFVFILAIIIFIVFFEKSGLEGKFIGRVIMLFLVLSLIMTAISLADQIQITPTNRTFQSNISP